MSASMRRSRGLALFQAPRGPSVTGLTKALSGQPPRNIFRRREETIRNSLIVRVFLVAMATAAPVFASANAEPAETGHEAAIKACSTVNPTQPVTVLSAVDDGTGIGFSLVWLNNKDGNLWMCDADADGNVYVYSILTGDLWCRRRVDRPPVDGRRRV